MGLLQIRIPNEAIPDDIKASSFTLSLKIRDGTRFFFLRILSNPFRSKSVEHCHDTKRESRLVCQEKQWEYSKIRHPEALPIAGGDDYIGVSCKSGNNNSKRDVCPTIPPAGFQIDDSAPDFGVTFGSETGHNYHNYSRAANHCIHLYCEGGDGDAWEKHSECESKAQKTH